MSSHVIRLKDDKDTTKLRQIGSHIPSIAEYRSVTFYNLNHIELNNIIELAVKNGIEIESSVKDPSLDLMGQI